MWLLRSEPERWLAQHVSQVAIGSEFQNQGVWLQPNTIFCTEVTKPELKSGRQRAKETAMRRDPIKDLARLVWRDSASPCRLLKIFIFTDPV